MKRRQRFAKADYYELDWYYEECTDGKSKDSFFPSGGKRAGCFESNINDATLKGFAKMLNIIELGVKRIHLCCICWLSHIHML